MHGNVIALDVGGSQVKAGIVDGGLRDVHTLSRPTNRLAGVVPLDQLTGLITELSDMATDRGLDVRAVGVAVPGIVDERRGHVRLAANLGWHDHPIGSLLADRVALPLRIGHDVRSGGLAEFTVGAAKGVADTLFVAIGTGIAAAVRCGGSDVSAGGFAGELGHLVIDPAGAPCPCGARGCLETIASAQAIVRDYLRRTGNRVTAADVATLVDAGDPVAAEVWRVAVAALATALAAAVSLLAPEVVVVGGGLAECGDVLLRPLRVEVARRLSFQRRPAIVTARFGAQAGRIGAALLAWRAAGG
ncbi:MAG TPA: ROK family protein [Pseudonocardiaceae bacterium]|nr:ROK family protein [Pseudonocardiaceae bacterium]